MELELLGGEPFVLEPTEDKVMLINFWASWCIPCVSEIPRITESLKSSDDLIVVGVLYQDSRERARKFIDKKAPGWRLVYDADGEIARAFDVSTPPGIPQSFFVGKDGVVRSRVYGEMTPERLNAELASARSSAGSVPAE